MDPLEHFYVDDPRQAHPDATTVVGDVDYFFLGNGYVQGAVQVGREKDFTALGLLVMAPGRLEPKRAALTFDDDLGLVPTQVELREGEREYRPRPGRVLASWTEVEGVPAVTARWSDDDFEVEEHFWCPDRRTARLVREVRVRSSARPDACLTVRIGGLEEELELIGGYSDAVVLAYELFAEGDPPALSLTWCDRPEVDYATLAMWTQGTRYASSSPLADHLLRTARVQLPAVIGADGAVDGSIWQYNLEWVRDQSMVNQGLVLFGETVLAGRMLRRLFDEFVTDEGDTVDSGRTRDPQDVELDQNGALLRTLDHYVRWTGDLDILREKWPKIRATADFPLRDVFRDEATGLLHNRREYWERHAAYGIEDGFELTYQYEVAAGLTALAPLARILGEDVDAARWEEEGAKLRRAMLEHPTCSLVENGHFIKRRGRDGAVQNEVTVAPDAVLPPNIPILADGPHYLNPDTSIVLPIATEFIDPRGDLARETLREVETLWNLHWEGGGYSRYHTSSEGDSPGPWPFASLFVARAYLEAGNAPRAEDVLAWLGTVPGRHAGTFFEFYGEKPGPPCPPTGVPPWTWAELALLFVHHHLGVRPGLEELVIRPRLFPATDRVEAKVRVRGRAISLDLQRAEEGAPTQLAVNGKPCGGGADGIHLPLPTGSLHITGSVGA